MNLVGHLIIAALLAGPAAGLIACSKSEQPGAHEEEGGHAHEEGDEHAGHVHAGEGGHAGEEEGEHAGHDHEAEGEHAGHDHEEEGGHANEGEAGHDHGEEAGHGDDTGAGGHEGHEEGVAQLTPEAAARAKIRVAPAVQRDVPFVLNTTARVDYDERRLAHVSPRIAGRVALVEAELGDDVKAGELLATLDSIGLGEAKAAYLTARAEESVARKTRAREERLFREKISSEQSAIETRGAHEKALAQLRSAEETLRLLGLADEDIRKVRYGDPKSSVFPLTAPIDGRVVEKHLVIGELVSPDEKVFTIADLSQLWIWIDVYERDLARVHAEDSVQVMTEAYPGRTFEGHVAYVSDRVDPDTRAARARIDIPNAEGLLKPGMFAQVIVTDPHGQSGRTGVAIPPSAVVRDGDRELAFVKEGERRYERRVLRIGARTADLVEVIEGVAPGEEVVVEGAFLLKSEIAKEEMGGGHSH